MGVGVHFDVGNVEMFLTHLTDMTRGFGINLWFRRVARAKVELVRAL